MENIEFGSDFHLHNFNDSEKIKFHSNAQFYGCGRHAINNLLYYHLKTGKWKRLFVPIYFCYEVIDSIRETGIELVFYNDYPLANDNEVISKINFREGDVLLRMNYFGLREYRDNSNIPVDVIEDHSHNINSDWAKNSNADWCVASLRKTLPLPDGGIIWSPKGYKIPKVSITESHRKLVELRYNAMIQKRDYLLNKNVSKDEYRRKYIESENLFVGSEVSGMSFTSKELIKNIPIDIDSYKKENFLQISRLLKEYDITILNPEYGNKYPFSVVLLFNSEKNRDYIRSYLLNNKVYTAILWEIRNQDCRSEILDFSKRMLSLHIDFRYSLNDIELVCSKIVSGLNELNKRI